MTETATQPRATGTTPSAEISPQAKEFAAQLRVKEGSEPIALEALRDLARTCVIRFGIPSDQVSSLPTILDIPHTSNLKYPPRGIQVDPRWERLSGALRLPAEGAFALDGPLIIANERERAALQGAIEGLVADVQGAGRLQAIDPQIAATLKNHIDAVRIAVYSDKVVSLQSTNPESYKALVQALRQLAIYTKDGPKWALVSEQEHQILTAFAEEARRISTADRFPDLKDRITQPHESLLAHLSMQWVWDDKLEQWGPQLPNTRYINSSLFRLSATALTAAMAEKLAPAAYPFLESLWTARVNYERDGNGAQLRLAQRAALREALKKTE